jgi:hypothetical protein
MCKTLKEPAEEYPSILLSFYSFIVKNSSTSNAKTLNAIC